MNFEDLYKQYKKLVYNLSLHYTQNIEDAEEVTQDVFIRIYEKMYTFKDKSSIKTWIYRITINMSLDYIKAKKRKKRWATFFSFNIDSENVENIHINFNHPGVELEQKEAVAAIFNKLNQLSEKQKNIIVLFKIEKLPLEEVAEILNLSTKATESLFFRAKKNLEKKLFQSEE